ncbi:SEC-C metal-binding domain-containing protein [Bradyrhizobium erythrophlei]|uniref:SEC-C metal-binding domain-containing protein n=1 Tax=Bradyrhizobium erythrophlei TaxID=1437360 RepID=UPI0023EA5E15|nr:SEC-C metal-binding domain-containing protein [Bradyrhizobium erythrophlei]
MVRGERRRFHRKRRYGSEALRRSCRIFKWRPSCASSTISKTSPAFSISRKRRKSYPSETQVKRGRRVVHGDVELTEKLGRNDLCPCGSGRRFQSLLLEVGDV